jgi:hypothetical protein
MFVNMKKWKFLLTLLLGSNLLFAQKNGIEHQAMMADALLHIPATPNKPQNPSFKIMREPVLAADFQEFITYLYSKNNIVEGNLCMAAVAKDVTLPTKYVLLSNPDPIAIYAKYLSQKMTTKSKLVTYTLVTEKQWKQIKGMPDTYEVPKKNPYGIIFQQGIFEWKQINKEKIETFTDTNGYQRSAFRLTYKETPIKSTTKK